MPTIFALDLPTSSLIPVVTQCDFTFTIYLFLIKCLSKLALAFSLLGDPGKPIITGVPTQPVNPGKVVELECRSLGTSPITKLLWFKNGQELGQRSYTVEGDYVVTRLTHVAELGDTTPIECRLEFQPKNLRISTFANIAIVGASL